MKVLIVGGVAGGASTAGRLRRMDENAEIILFERGPYVSFANCGLPYQLGGVISEREKLLVSSPKVLKENLNLEARVNSEVIAIDRASKTIQVRNTQNGAISMEAYDKLVLSPGATPVRPPLPGLDLPGVFVLHNIPELDAIQDFLRKSNARTAVVIGGGFIGLEVAENLVERGLLVSLVEMLPQVLAPVDPEMAAQVHDHLALHGVQLFLGEALQAVEATDGPLSVQLKSGKRLPTDLVILSIGVRPETALAKAAGLELGPRGHIVTNEFMQTSDPDIYALGDAAQVQSFFTGKPTALALAGPASRQGRIVADHIVGHPRPFRGVIGTSVVKIFDLTVACTGMNTRALQDAGLPFNSVSLHNNDHADYYPGATPINLKLLFGPQGEIYGAQAVGVAGVEKRIDVVATAILGKMNVFDLEEVELSYAPPYSSSRDPINNAAFQAANILRGDVPVKHWDDVAELDPKSWFLLDARLPEEVAVGQIPGAVNIPLQQIRTRLNELPKDRSILVNCASGKRSYLTVRALRQLGYDAWNLSGGYKTYCLGASSVEKAPNCPPPGESAKKAPETVPAETPKQAGQVYQLDACGLQCPGPILKLYNQMKTMQDGDSVTVQATDLGFARDVEAWAKSTGNTLLSLQAQHGKIVAQLQKGLGTAATPVTPSSAVATQGKDLTMVVFSGDLDKAIAALIIANGFASLGQQATLFFTFWGLNILRKDEQVPVKKTFIEKMFGWMMPRGARKLGLSRMSMMGAGTAMIKGIMKKNNVDSLPEMIRTAQANGVKLLACQMSMDLMGIKHEELIDGVEVAGVATMAAAASVSNTHYFI